MKRLSIPTAALVLAMFGVVSIGWAGEMKAKMEEIKGDMKAKVEEAKGEAKAAVEEAKGNKGSSRVERAKGKGNAAMERQGQGQGAESEDGIACFPFEEARPACVGAACRRRRSLRRRSASRCVLCRHCPRAVLPLQSRRRRRWSAHRYANGPMLLSFVILYLACSVGIGLYAATRVRNPRISPSPGGVCLCRW